MAKTIQLFSLLLFLIYSNNFSASQLTEDEVYNLFISSEFEKARDLMNSFVASHKTISHQDSVVWLKYMGAIALNNPDSADRAEIYWRELLSIQPDANIDNLMLPNEYDALFEQLKNEISDTAEPSPPPPPEPIVKPGLPKEPSESSPPPKPKNSLAWAWWTAGGVILAGAATAFTIAIINTGNGTRIINPEIPDTLSNASSQMSGVFY